MIGLRRGPVSCRSFIRLNSTLQAKTSGAESSVPPPANSETPVTEDVVAETDTKVYKTRRPNISLTRPRQWNRPVVKGVLPAYDQAIRVIQEDSASLKREVEHYQKMLADTKLVPDADPAAVQLLEDKLRILQVQSEVNLPDVRWKFKNGLSDMSKPVYQHLAEHKWRGDGDLDLLMERIHQMHVVPDVLPDLRPTIDLRVTFPEPPPNSVYLRTRIKRAYKPVEPGLFLLPEQTRRAPKLYTSVFHPETRLYTMLMVDPDVPDPANQSFKTYLHWMQPNIALNSLSENPIPLSMIHTRYVPPHPQKGTPYHRYVILLLPQESTTERLAIPVPTDAERLSFNVREFTEKYGMDGGKGGAAHMWREVWDEQVSDIYAETLKLEEPRYTLPPKPDRYADIRGARKYVK